MDRITGWAELLSRLGDPDADIKPTLYIHSRCARMAACPPLPPARSQPARRHSQSRRDDNGIGGDDPADALRYLITARKPNFGFALA